MAKTTSETCGLCAIEAGVTVGTNGWQGKRPTAHAPGCPRDSKRTPTVMRETTMLVESSYTTRRGFYRPKTVALMMDGRGVVRGFGVTLLGCVPRVARQVARLKGGVR